MKVIVEKNELDVCYEPNKTYPVLKDFKVEQVLGYAKITLENGALYADFKLNKSVKGYPAIGYRIMGDFKRMFAIGISETRNQDESIDPIEYIVRLEGKPSNLKTK